MSYLLELRKLVGHQPLIMVGATMLLINQQKELLMMMKVTWYLLFSCNKMNV